MCIGSVLGIPSYYNTPEFLYADAPHNIINKHPTIETEVQHDKEIKLNEAAKEESQHNNNVESSESHDMKAKKSSLPEFTANRDTMLLEVSANSYLMMLQNEM